MTINLGLTTRDVARELARRYSTMTHEELDQFAREHGMIASYDGMKVNF